MKKYNGGIKMKWFKVFGLFVVVMLLSSCYLTMVEEVTEAVPMPQDSEVLIAAYQAKYAGAYRTVDTAYLGAVGSSPEVLTAVANLLALPGMVSTVGEMYKVTFASVVNTEISKNEFIPYSVRQIRSWGKFGTGSRTIGTVGDITTPLSVDGTQKK